MQQISQITDDPLQVQSIILPDGTSFVFTLYFSPQQYGWFITSLVYGTFTLQGLRVVNSPNMLRQYKNFIEFGLTCISAADREPSQPQDFSSGNSVLYVLSSTEVAAYEAFLSAK